MSEASAEETPITNQLTESSQAAPAPASEEPNPQKNPQLSQDPPGQKDHQESSSPNGAEIPESHSLECASTTAIYDNSEIRFHPEGSPDQQRLPPVLEGVVSSPSRQSSLEKLVVKKGYLLRKLDKKEGKKMMTMRTWKQYYVELHETTLLFFLESQKVEAEARESHEDPEHDKEEEKEKEREREEEEREKEKEKEEKEKEKEEEEKEKAKEEEKEREEREREEKEKEKEDKEDKEDKDKAKKDKKKKKEEEEEEKRLKKEREKREKELKEAAKKKEKEEKKERERREKEEKKERERKEKEEKKRQKKGEKEDDTEDPVAPHPDLEKNAVDSISIKAATTEIDPEFKKKKFVFRLILDNKNEYLFEAPDEKEMNLWMEAINAFSKMTDEASTPYTPHPSMDISHPPPEDTSPQRKPSKLLGKILGKTEKKIKHKKIFGADIVDQPLSEDLGIPLFIEKCVSVVEAHGFQSVGIYRLSGTAAAIADLKEKIDQDISKVNFASPAAYEGDLNVITGLLKTYLREMPDPLMTFLYYDSFIAAGKIDNYDDRMYSIQHIISLLPEINYRTLQFLAGHLARLAQHEQVNKMAPQNLAIVFGPNILRSKEESALSMLTEMNVQCAVVEAIILQPEWMFSIERKKQ